jgi:hypothetical protein
MHGADTQPGLGIEQCRPMLSFDVVVRRYEGRGRGELDMRLLIT